MDLETAQKITDLQRRFDLQELPERPTDLVSSFMALPGLRGFWPMSAFSATGNAFDQSSNGRTLTYNGNPTYNYDGLVPYLDLDGTGDFLSRADEAGLDILGTETYVAAAVRGLTFGGWFWMDSKATDAALIAKQQNATPANRSYNLVYIQGNDQIELYLNGVQNAVLTAPSANKWFFAVGKYVPSGNSFVFLNGVRSAAVAGPASLNNSPGPLEIGATFTGTVSFLNGRASLCFLCAAALSDAIIDAAFQATRAAFGV